MDRTNRRGLSPIDQLLCTLSKRRTMDTEIKLLDVVALTEDLPDRGLRRGQVGTVVELLAPGVFEVEFSDDEGRSYATLALRADQLMPLHYHPAGTGRTLQAG